MQGILLVDKPSGWTSFDVVNRVRRLVAEVEGKKPKSCKVGHTGTLDPLATGLLVILVGKDYTRQAADLMKHDKTYDVTMRLGETSTTGDDEGEKIVVSDTIPTEKQLLEAFLAFTGDIMQRPPAYSAIKVNGVRSYDLARKGRAVELEARPVHIESISLESYDYPLVQFRCEVGSGTYIRSLVEDIGDRLGTGAYMSGLKRTVVGDFNLSNALSAENLSIEAISDRIFTLP